MTPPERLAVALAVVAVAAAAARAQESTMRVVRHARDLPAGKRACTHDADCNYTELRCCPSCGVVHATDVVAVTEALREDVERASCREHVGCPRCAGTSEPGLDAACVRGRCEVVVRGAPAVPRVDAPDGGAPLPAVAPAAMVSEGLRGCRTSNDCTAASVDDCPRCGHVGADALVPIAARGLVAWENARRSATPAPDCAGCAATVDPTLGVACVRGLCALVRRAPTCARGQHWSAHEGASLGGPPAAGCCRDGTEWSASPVTQSESSAPSGGEGGGCCRPGQCWSGSQCIRAEDASPGDARFGGTSWDCVPVPGELPGSTAGRGGGSLAPGH